MPNTHRRRNSQDASVGTLIWRFCRDRLWSIPGATIAAAIITTLGVIIGSFFGLFEVVATAWTSHTPSPQNNTVVVNVSPAVSTVDQKSPTSEVSSSNVLKRAVEESTPTESRVAPQIRPDGDVSPNAGANWLTLKRELDEAGGYLNLNSDGQPEEICFEGIPNERIVAIIEEYSDLSKFVTYVSCDLTSVNDETLKWIGRLDRANTLRLNESGVRGHGLHYINEMENLSRLSLRHTKIEDRSLTHLVQLTKLERLNLSENAGIGKSLEALQLMTNLKYLGLWNTNVDTSSLLQLGDMPSLGTLAISSPNLSDDSLREMAAAIEGGQKFRKLTELHINSEIDFSMELLDRIKAAMEKRAGSAFVTSEEPDPEIWK